MHNNGGCGVDIGQTPDIGCTAMVGLALMAQGNTPIEGPRSREIRKIVNFLLTKVENMPNDDVTQEQGTQLQNKIVVTLIVFSLRYSWQKYLARDMIRNLSDKPCGR